MKRVARLGLVRWSVLGALALVVGVLGYGPGTLSNAEPQPDEGTHGLVELQRLALERAGAIADLSVRWQVPWDLAEALYAGALRYGLDPEFALALAYVESRFEREAVSRAGARGLLQIMPRTAREMGCELDRLFELESNVDCGLRYFARLLAREGNVETALLVYNGCKSRGPHCVGYPGMVLAQAALRGR